MQSALEFLKEIFNINDATAATITITLFVFVSGFLLNGIKNLISGFLNRGNLRRFIIVNTTSLSKKSKELAKEFESFSEQLKGYGNILSLNRTGVSQISIFKEMGYLKSSNAFFSGVENVCISDSIRQSFNELWEIIDDIEYWEDQRNTVSEYNKQYEHYNSDRNKALIEFQRLIESEIPTNILHPDSEISAYFKKANKIFLDWQRESNPGPDIIHRMLVKEFLGLNRESNHAKIPMITEINYYLMEASLSFSNLKNLNESYSKLYYKLSESFAKNGSKLDKIAIELDNKKLF